MELYLLHRIRGLCGLCLTLLLLELELGHGLLATFVWGCHGKITSIQILAKDMRDNVLKSKQEAVFRIIKEILPCVPEEGYRGSLNPGAGEDDMDING